MIPGIIREAIMDSQSLLGLLQKVPAAIVFPRGDSYRVLYAA